MTTIGELRQSIMDSIESLMIAVSFLAEARLNDREDMITKYEAEVKKYTELILSKAIDNIPLNTGNTQFGH